MINVNVIALMSSSNDAPAHLQGRDRDDWLGTLERCRKAGLLSRLDIDIYRMHPALPSYLISLWRKTAGERLDNAYEISLVACINAHAYLLYWLGNQNEEIWAETAMVLLCIGKPTFLSMASSAVDIGLYNQAHQINWFDRLQEHLEAIDGTAFNFDSDAGTL